MTWTMPPTGHPTTSRKTSCLHPCSQVPSSCGKTHHGTIARDEYTAASAEASRRASPVRPICATGPRWVEWTKSATARCSSTFRIRTLPRIARWTGLSRPMDINDWAPMIDSGDTGAPLITRANARLRLNGEGWYLAANARRAMHIVWQIAYDQHCHWRGDTKHTLYPGSRIQAAISHFSCRIAEVAFLCPHAARAKSAPTAA